MPHRRNDPDRRQSVQPPGHPWRCRAGQDAPARSDRPRPAGGHPGLKVIQVTAEAFTNSFLDAMRTGTLSGFRTRYRGAGRCSSTTSISWPPSAATQDEFLHTFNALIAEGVPIVLTADQHPRRIARLTDELVDPVPRRDGREARGP